MPYFPSKKRCERVRASRVQTQLVSQRPKALRAFLYIFLSETHYIEAFCVGTETSFGISRTFMFKVFGGTVTVKAIENFITSCPLLEKFKFTNIFNPLALIVCAPNLKHLELTGLFTDVYLKHTPCLDAISLNFFGKSPNLQELEIIALGHESYSKKAAALDFWEKECPSNFTFKHLKMVVMSGVSNENDVEFLKFVLGRSPMLEVLSISPDAYYKRKMNMVNQVLRFQRAFPEVEIKFFDC
ncbi:hypothetical protein POM88_000894 [Heracleum sosnowskyi]|uniref:FBD domain-containing protein n=1 Tax=Heracleum sosnowskyi TaxID=360622 RepID=A0AAD8JBY9_9APIA|nr:hypothetical protein POM88_000894 [Heracleum sosnowskyi]